MKKLFAKLTQDQQLSYLFKKPEEIQHEGFRGAIALLWDPNHHVNGGHPQTAYEMASFFNGAHKALFGTLPANCVACNDAATSETTFFIERALI